LSASFVSIGFACQHWLCGIGIGFAALLVSIGFAVVGMAAPAPPLAPADVTNFLDTFKWPEHALRRLQADFTYSAEHLRRKFASRHA